MRSVGLSSPDCVCFGTGIVSNTKGETKGCGGFRDNGGSRNCQKGKQGEFRDHPETRIKTAVWKAVEVVQADTHTFRPSQPNHHIIIIEEQKR